jgi:uncharacterized protein (DUF305 family)
MFALLTLACGDDEETTVQQPPPDHNTADVTFTHGMIPHHEQAITMSDLALQQAARPQVKSLASRIKAAQAPEIEKMKGWLTSWGEPHTAPSGGHGGHGGGQMSGMLSDAEITQLRSASGPQFDKLFLEGMIRHHEGAIVMAEEELNKGIFADAKALARQIVDSQRAEINDMRALLSG